MNIRKGYTRQYMLFTFLSIMAALGSMGVVFMINRIVNNYFTGTPVTVGYYFLYFLGALLLFLTSRWLVSIAIITFTQKLLLKTRMDVLQMVLRSPWTFVSGNREKIYNALTRDTDSIVNASINVVDILTNSAIALVCFVYMGILAWQLLLCMIGVLAITLLVYFFYVNKARKLFMKAMAFHDGFVKYLNEILSGFKEISIERKKGSEISEKHVRTAVTAVSAHHKKAHVTFLNNRIIGIMSFYVFIGMLLLYLGSIFTIPDRVVVNFIFLILYIFGPIENVVLMIPSLTQANASLKRLNTIESQMINQTLDHERINSYTSFQELKLENISYRYKSAADEEAEKAFGIGPVDFRLNQGEIVFISGGNGSGKTTFINILIGLFEAEQGDIYIDDKKIEKNELPDYHSLFAPVFNDFHLFDELYGIHKIDNTKVQEYLQLFELNSKVTFQGNKFSTTNLSAGQRKRLALIYAMLENKPILILDEFAADQDPQFKKKFYAEIIPYIKQEGFSMIAITHDDNFYAAADKLYKMDSGQLRKLELKNSYQIYS